ncbi:hypothetical protein GSI_08985 [Ganoderma sinense ZZ0214-1]|uniref:Uncharacterized protein n=1 Tax=Ganoderma sinense ZZ0214-1 TaxID=1077348 RepID=A0A2G8S5X6_9APHY|nr:hypothetical protein GSI_08985 [Ganoderma sinense ZZ0214-1]
MRIWHATKLVWPNVGYRKKALGWFGEAVWLPSMVKDLAFQDEVRAVLNKVAMVGSASPTCDGTLPSKSKSAVARWPGALYNGARKVILRTTVTPTFHKPTATLRCEPVQYRPMRLLDTHTGRFFEVHDPNSVEYAVLSHAWDSAGEQSYDDVWRIHASLYLKIEAIVFWRRKQIPRVLHGAIRSTESSHSNSSDDAGQGLRRAAMNIRSWNSYRFSPRISPNIRRACAVARAYGHRLLWIDLCCIDKTSSSELSEAIKSMWFRRGWTLQELIARRVLVFLSTEWQFLGTKSSLAEVIEEVTGISSAVLCHQMPLSEVPVAKRMSWAANCKTTRKEDQAYSYSLLGIFDISMSTLYGEGGRAFIRLQEETLKRVPDQSLFAWTLSDQIPPGPLSAFAEAYRRQLGVRAHREPPPVESQVVCVVGNRPAHAVAIFRQLAGYVISCSVDSFSGNKLALTRGDMRLSIQHRRRRPQDPNDPFVVVWVAPTAGGESTQWDEQPSITLDLRRIRNCKEFAFEAAVEGRRVVLHFTLSCMFVSFFWTWRFWTRRSRHPRRPVRQS